MPDSKNRKGDPIKHIVFLMMENRSFDQMLGALKAIYPGLEGVDPNNPYFNDDPEGQRYFQLPTTERQMWVDPQHFLNNVARQMDGGTMKGFVRDFAIEHPDSTELERQFVMGYYPLGFLPATHTLARHFMICDHWFSSVPGPTFPNRYFGLSGSSRGYVEMQRRSGLSKWFEEDQTTIFDRLSERGISWRAYFHDLPLSFAFTHQRRPQNAARCYGIEQFYKDVKGREADFPSFASIEPRFHGLNENDDHPPHDIMKGQRLIAYIYNALRSNEELWNSTLFVITYDEHGGFFDHVYPPKAMPPDERKQEYSFDQLGLRVPALLVSPWVRRGYDSTVFDHTSLLKYMIDKWQLGSLGERANEANSFAHLIGMENPRTDTVASIQMSGAELMPPDPVADGKTETHVTDLNAISAELLQYVRAQAGLELPRGLSDIARLHRRTRRWFLDVVHWKTRADKDILLAYQEVVKLVRLYVEQCRKTR